MIKIDRSTILFCVLLGFLIAFLYRGAFFSYFFQDDWFTFLISWPHSLEDFFKFFIPRTDVIYYRPLGMQVAFFIVRLLFNLNPFGYRLITFLTHLGSSCFVFYLSQQIGLKKSSACFAAFLYATSTIFYIPFYWFATYPFILGPFFVLASLILLLKNKTRGAIFCYIAALLTYELSFLTIPLALLLRHGLKKKIPVQPVIMMTLTTVMLFATRFVFFHPPAQGDYSPAFSKETIRAVSAYGMWLINWPEEMKNQMVRLGVFNGVFTAEFYHYTNVFFVSFYMLLAVIIVSIGYGLLIRKITLKIIRFIGVFGGWIMIGIAPMLIFPSHTFSYYLPLSLIGFGIGIAKMVSIFSSNYRLIAYGIIGLAWYGCALTATDFNKKVHWAPRRAKISYEHVEAAKHTYQNNHTQGWNYIASGGIETKFALNDQDGMRVALDDLSVITRYVK